LAAQVAEPQQHPEGPSIQHSEPGQVECEFDRDIGETDQSQGGVQARSNEPSSMIRRGAVDPATDACRPRIRI